MTELDFLEALGSSTAGSASVITLSLVAISVYLKKLLTELRQDKIQSFKGETEIDLIQVLRDEVERLRTDYAEDREINRAEINSLKEEYSKERQDLLDKISKLEFQVNSLLEYQEEVRIRLQDAYDFVEANDEGCDKVCATGIKYRLKNLIEADVE